MLLTTQDPILSASTLAFPWHFRPIMILALPRLVTRWILALLPAFLDPGTPACSILAFSREPGTSPVDEEKR